MNYTDFFKRAYGTVLRHSGSRETAVRNPEKELHKNLGPYHYQKKLAEDDWPDLLETSPVPETETPPRGRRRADDALIGGVDIVNIIIGRHPVKDAGEDRCIV